MKFKIIYLALALVLAALPLALGGAAPVVQSAGEYSFHATDQLFCYADVGPHTDHVDADREFRGTYGWHFIIVNDNSATVYEPVISVDSSLDPSYFSNVDEFPATWSLPSLDPWTGWYLKALAHSSYPVTFTLGYDCSRTMEPLEIPPGGGVQTVTISVKPIDTRYTSAFVHVVVDGSAIENSNIQPEWADVIIEPGQIGWGGESESQLGEYTFSVQLQVTNPSDASLVHRPRVNVYVEPDAVIHEVPGITSGVTIYDEILSGSITYSFAASGKWQHNTINPYEVNFDPMAEYMVAEYDLTIVSSEGGFVITPDEGDFTYEEGTVVDLEAEPDEGYQFVEWIGDVDTVGDIEAASTTITMNDDYSIVANFEEIPPIPTGCFIATATYGTPMAEELQILREFKDGCLLTNRLGRALVDIYYSVSPPIADFISEHPSLKPIVRAGLMPIVAMCGMLLNIVLQ